MAEMLASRAWAVQMLEVALSRLMCCSRVCMAIRNASLPFTSLLTPVSAACCQQGIYSANRPVHIGGGHTYTHIYVVHIVTTSGAVPAS